MATPALHLARAEREELADFLSGLTDDQWRASSLCAGWSVRDVAAHTMSFEGLPASALASRFVRGYLQTDRINQIGVEAMAGHSTDELVALVRENAEPQGLGAGFGGRIALTDNMIHQQDIRRPLGLPRGIEPERLLTALEFARFAPLIRGAWQARGVRLVATDVDWSAGKGPEVTGPGEALLMAMAGRGDALRDLDGPGKELLSARF